MVNVFPLLVAALFSDPDLGRSFYREHIAPQIRWRGKVLETLARDELDPNFIGLANFGMLFAIALDQHFGGSKPAVAGANLAQLAKQFARMATGGFARDKERKAIAKSIDDEAA
jgi:hypothetical protein